MGDDRHRDQRPWNGRPFQLNVDEMNNLLQVIPGLESRVSLTN